MKKMVFHPDAARELEHSALYYESQGKGLGQRLLRQFELGLTQILERPDAWPPLVYLPIRRYLLRFFPYAIIYKNDPEILYILAVMHLSRKPGYWMNRL